VCALKMRSERRVRGFHDRLCRGRQLRLARPVGIAGVAHDGALLVSEDGNGTIWRITYRGGP